MPLEEHLLERRAGLLASKLTSQIQSLSQTLVPKGSRVPFTQQMSKPEALRWWQQHIGDEFGKKVLGRMTAQDQLELYNALSQAQTEREAGYGGPPT